MCELDVPNVLQFLGEMVVAHTQFIPGNATERALLEAMQGRMSVPEFLRVLLDAEVYIPSSSPVDSEGNGFQPLLFDRNNETLMSLFTSGERTTGSPVPLPYCLTMKFHHLLQRIPSEFGIVINPGWEVGMEISAEGVGNIRRDFLTQ